MAERKEFSITEASVILGKTRVYVWYLIKCGMIKAKRVGKVWVIAEKEIIKARKRIENEKKEQ